MNKSHEGSNTAKFDCHSSSGRMWKSNVSFSDNSTYPRVTPERRKKAWSATWKMHKTHAGSHPTKFNCYCYLGKRWKLNVSFSENLPYPRVIPEPRERVWSATCQINESPAGSNPSKFDCHSYLGRMWKSNVSFLRQFHVPPCNSRTTQKGVVSHLENAQDACRESPYQV